MKLDEIRNSAQITFQSLYNGQNPHVLVGTATCGRAAGAMAVLEAFRREIADRNLNAGVSEVGCLGLCSEEPLVTIIKPGDFTVCYGRVISQVVPQLVEGYLQGDDPCLELALGTLAGGDGEAVYIPELERFNHEQRLLLRNCGYLSPLEIDHYIACGGYAGLRAALRLKPAQIIKELENSGLRGRGGAGFTTADKLKLCRQARGKPKYILCNADEGDPGAFMDRVLLESDPHACIEGMCISAYAVGSNQGFIYVRDEYPLAIERLKIAIKQAEDKGLLGNDILGSGFKFTSEIVRGAGAFVSGEESAMIAAIEGRRSWPEHRPPYPSRSGLWGRPTLVQNVKTLSFMPLILQRGGAWFAGTGTRNSPGTALFALAGKLANTGLAEVSMGTTLRTLIYEIGGGVRRDKKFKAVQIGGPSGGCLPESLLDTPIDFDSLQEAGAIMGSGGIIVMDEDNCPVDTAKFFTDFSRQESCGKCTFCRIGISQMHGILEEITLGKAEPDAPDRLQALASDVKAGSLCGLGRMAPNPVLTSLRYFRDEYDAHILEGRCPARVCKDLTAYYILPEKCFRGCEHCVLACPAEAIFSDEQGLKIVDQVKCTRCSSCELVCPPEYNAVIRLSPVSLVPPGRRTRPQIPSQEP
jgi:NADH-quinone oxidoreductase subunit F